MSKKIFNRINNVIYTVFILVTVYSFIDIYLIKGGFSAGTCPIDNNRTLLYLAITLGVLSFGFSTLEKYLTSKVDEQ